MVGNTSRLAKLAETMVVEEDVDQIRVDQRLFWSSYIQGLTSQYTVRTRDGSISISMLCWGCACAFSYRQSTTHLTHTYIYLRSP